MPDYATVRDYAAFLEEDPDSYTAPPRLDADLESASQLVRRCTKTAVYQTDEDGIPTEPQVAEAFTAATCAQAEWFQEIGDNTGVGGFYNSMSIGSVALAGARGSDVPGGGRLAAKAATILDNAGLLGNPPYTGW